MSVLPFPDMRARFAIASFTTVAALAFASADAHAYCQTTTEKETAGYDPSVSGCWTTGVPLKWNARDVNYSLDVGASTLKYNRPIATMNAFAPIVTPDQFIDVGSAVSDL